MKGGGRKFISDRLSTNKCKGNDRGNEKSFENPNTT